jgi:hypothetical protein
VTTEEAAPKDDTTVVMGEQVEEKAASATSASPARQSTLFASRREAEQQLDPVETYEGGFSVTMNRPGSGSGSGSGIGGDSGANRDEGSKRGDKYQASGFNMTGKSMHDGRYSTCLKQKRPPR